MTRPDDTGRPEVERLAYTPAEIAAAAGLSRKAIYRAIENGELRAAKVCNGSRLLIPREAAREWIERNLVSPRTVTPTRHGPLGPERRPGRVLGEALKGLGRVGAQE